MLNRTASITNIGDFVQILAVENIYRKMGVEEKDVYRIPVNEISKYRGEKLLLPINFPMFGIYDLSPDITPVYLGLSVIHHSVSAGLRLKQYEPIGCRDEHTFRELSSLGLRCYHGGCLSVTFQRREKAPCDGRVYLVGLSDSIVNGLPPAIKENSVRSDHVYLGSTPPTMSDARDILKCYKENASLVVTSKIHCAQPCLAMGIPVVFICEERSFRYEVIQRYLPIYSLEDLKDDRIDWSPKPVDIEETKKILEKNAIERIRCAYLSESDGGGWPRENAERLVAQVDEINSPYELREYDIDMISAFEKYLEKRFKYSENFHYSIWGVTQFAYMAYERVKEKYPNSVLDMIVDKNSRLSFYGYIPKNPEELKGYCNTVLFAVPSAVGVARDEFIRYGVKYYIVSYGGVLIEDGKILLKPYGEEK